MAVNAAAPDVQGGGTSARQAPAGCPLCGHPAARPSWMGSTRYFEQTFQYVECQSCRSAYCQPMPDTRTLAKMYGTTYAQGCGSDLDIDDPKEPQHVRRWLGRSTPGTFIDYGCGEGQLLVEARAAGWRAVGLELDPEVASRTAKRSGAEVLSDPEQLASRARADVLHLGDVIEHLTDLDRQMPSILACLKPGGVLLAQGPLEGNMNLFTLALRGQRLLRGSPPASFPPYHVLLATVEGQRRFFQRFGLTELEYLVREVAWPAPSRLGLADLTKPRNVALFALRRASQLVSSLRPAAWGNRYFYAGRKPE